MHFLLFLVLSDAFQNVRVRYDRHHGRHRDAHRDGEHASDDFPTRAKQISMK